MGWFDQGAAARAPRYDEAYRVGVPYGQGSLFQPHNGGAPKASGKDGLPVVATGVAANRVSGFLGVSAQSEDSDDDNLDAARHKEVTAEEKEEAEQIVRLAFKDAEERKKNREAAKHCSKEDLQALLNARLRK